jgi:hypothetical protein
MALLATAIDDAPRRGYSLGRFCALPFASKFSCTLRLGQILPKRFRPNGGRTGFPTNDFHRVKVAFVAQVIDGKVVISRQNRQNLPKRRYLPQKCHKANGT